MRRSRFGDVGISRGLILKLSLELQNILINLDPHRRRKIFCKDYILTVSEDLCFVVSVSTADVTCYELEQKW